MNARTQISIGIICSIVIGLGVVSFIFSNDKMSSSRYDGLTEEQKTKMRILEETCEQKTAEVEFFAGKEASKLYAQECKRSIEKTIQSWKEDQNTKRVITEAIQKQDISFCESIQQKELCVSSYARELRDPEACFTLVDNTGCLSQFELFYHNPAICRQATNQSHCFDAMFTYIGHTVCDEFVLAERNNCKEMFVEYKVRSEAYYRTKGDMARTLAVSDFAITSKNVNNCELLDNTKDNSLCVANYVKALQNPSFCSKARDSLYCLENAITGFGPTVCNTIDKELVESCQMVYTVNKISDPSLTTAFYDCQRFSNFGVWQTSCFLNDRQLEEIPTGILLSMEQNGELLICKNAPGIPSHWEPEQKKQYCVAGIGVYSKDLSICDRAGNARAECYGMIAATENTVTLKTCDRLESGQEFCYMNVAARTKDTPICESFFDDSFKRNCLSLIEGRTLKEQEKQKSSN